MSIRRSVRALWLGTRAAMLAPRLCDRRLSSLLAEPAASRTPPAAADEAATRLAITRAFALLSRLSRLPGARWRNTCLFRAAAECWILRVDGWPAVLRIGVRREDGHEATALPVAAHAWVECAGVRCMTERGSERATYALLRTPT